MSRGTSQAPSAALGRLLSWAHRWGHKASPSSPFLMETKKRSHPSLLCTTQNCASTARVSRVFCSRESCSDSSSPQLSLQSQGPVSRWPMAGLSKCSRWGLSRRVGFMHSSCDRDRDRFVSEMLLLGDQALTPRQRARRKAPDFLAASRAPARLPCPRSVSRDLSR